MKPSVTVTYLCKYFNNIFNMGPAHQKHVRYGQWNDRLLETEPKHRRKLHQRKGRPGKFSGGCQHSMGCSHLDKCTEARNGATEGRQICQEQTPKHPKCI